MSEVVARVRFLRRWHIYNRNEIAVYPLHEAERLVAMRVAEPMPPPVGVTTDEPPSQARRPTDIVRKAS